MGLSGITQTDTSGCTRHFRYEGPAVMGRVRELRSDGIDERPGPCSIRRPPNGGNETTSAHLGLSPMQQTSGNEIGLLATHR
jgi:hypothetical protein